MATIADITSGSSYRGDPILGGSFHQGVTIDPSPIEKLAAFTFYRDRDLWQQKQINDKAAAKEISDMTAYDVTSPLKGFNDYLKGKLGEIKDFVASNPNALNYGKDPKGFQKFKDLQREFQAARTAANTSEVIYSASRSAIDKLPIGAEKEAFQLELDDRVNSLFANGIEGALNNTLASAAELKPEDYKIPSLALTKRISVIKDPNNVEIDKVEILDADNLDNQAFAAWVGMKEPLDVNSADFKKLSPDKQKLAIAQDKVINRQRLGIERTAEVFNGMLQQLAATAPIDPATGKAIPIKIDAIDITQLPDGTFKDNILSAKSYNEQVDKINALTGEKFKKLNLDDGLAGWEILKLKAFQDNKSTLYSETDKDVRYTGAADKLKLERIQQSGANYRAALSSGSGQTTGETRNFMDLTGYTGTLTTADIAAIDPTLVESESGVFKLNNRGMKATFNILANGDVEVNYNDAAKTKKVINKTKYQKEAVTVTQTVLKDRKGEQGNPFTFTGISETKTEQSKTTGKMVMMVLPDGRTGEIPEDKVSEFLKEHPKAKRQ